MKLNPTGGVIRSNIFSQTSQYKNNRIWLKSILSVSGHIGRHAKYFKMDYDLSVWIPSILVLLQGSTQRWCLARKWPLGLGVAEYSAARKRGRSRPGLVPLTSCAYSQSSSLTRCKRCRIASYRHIYTPPKYHYMSWWVALFHQVTASSCPSVPFILPFAGWDTGHSVDSTGSACNCQNAFNKYFC